MVASVISPVDIGGMPGEERQLPVWMRGIAERNKLSNSMREPGRQTDDESYQRSLMKRLGHADVHARMVAAQCLAAASPKGSRAALNALLCIPKGRVINRSGATLSLSLGKKGVRDPSQQVQAACVESAGEHLPAVCPPPRSAFRLPCLTLAKLQMPNLVVAACGGLFYSARLFAMVLGPFVS
jgi:hypothetical protein